MHLQTHIDEALTCIGNATIGQELAKTFFPDGHPVPKEGVLWDYKVSIEDEKTSYAEAAKDIVSFFNSHGGYIFIGVSELKTDEMFKVCGFQKPDSFVTKLRAAVESYSSKIIDFSVSDVVFSGIVVTSIHIPKRPPTQPPAFLVRNGPEKKPGKPIFNERTTYFRENDKTLPATIPSQWEFLNSERRYEDIALAGLSVSSVAIATRNISHNLPDRNLICAHLFGREDLLVALWAWIADELEPVRLLAGAGGKGKTSVAYEFASHFFRKAPQPFVQVFWASAKKRQFLPERNDYMDMPECLYSSPRELLEALCIGTLALTAKELAEGDENEYTLHRRLRESLQLIPSLVIIDDIDSLVQSDQKRVFELTQQMVAGTPSKFLLTTRANFAFSDTQCILVPGLKGQPYKSFVEDRLSRLGIEKVKIGDIKNLQSKSDGSPLWTDSILRLLKQGRSLDAAVSEWSGKPGEDARAAALGKELDALSPPAKRILYVASALHISSRAELLEVTKVGKVEFDEAITQLQTLFLVDAPKIIDKEPRFSVPESTALAVAELGPKMVPDHQRLAVATRELQRSIQLRGSKPRTQVAYVISQAMALLRADKTDDAVATVDAALKAEPKNPDLLLLKGRCFMAVNLTKAAEAFADAHANGQRKELLFELWHEVLFKGGQTAACLDVGNLALDAKCEPTIWLPHKARARAEIGLMRSREGNPMAAIDSFNSAAADIARTLEQPHLSARQAEAHRGDLQVINDAAWKLASAGSGVEAGLIAFDVAQAALSSGDIRVTTVDHLVQVALTLATPEKQSDNFVAYRAGQLRIRNAIDALETAARKPHVDESTIKSIKISMAHLRSKF